MSNNSQDQSSEEVDLGQLFKAIGNLFSRLFNFIGNILNSLFLAFVWLVFFVKKHFIKFIVAGVIGISFGFLKENLLGPLYKSSIVVKQNYATGESLNSTLESYNNLISEKDSIVLAADLKVSPSEAANLKSFNLESILDDNQKLNLFDAYTKKLDSTLASTIEFTSYKDKGREYDYQFQKITIQAKTKNIFEKVFPQIIKNVESSQFFKNEQKKDLSELSRRENIILESLKESDSLQKVYQFVLEKSVEATNGSQTSVTIDNTEDKGITKEFELFNSDIGLRRELVEIQRDKDNLEHIIEVVSGEQNSGLLDQTKYIMGYSIGAKIFYGLVLVLLVFTLLLGFEFLKFLERFKNKI